METASSFSSPGSSPLKFIALTATLALFAACGGLETRSSVNTQTPPHGAAAEPAPAATPVAIPGPGAPVAPPPPAQSQPTFLSKEIPKVGVILGPGGMKTYAHIGVLRELQRARVPITAVAGLEWGAVIGGLFAVQGQANDAEWKSFKLRDSDLPSASFFNSQVKPQPISTLNEFLNTAFSTSTIEKAKVEFGCPAYWSKQDRFGWMQKGTFREAMRACVPYPPVYTDNAGVVASPFSVSEAAAWLRSKGANLIVLVDVLSQGEPMPAKGSSEGLSENLGWSEIRREMVRARSSVNQVIVVNTAGHPISDYNARRALMEAGSRAASDVVNKMATQYGF